MAKYKYIVPEVVDKLSHKLDGMKLYIMDCSDSEGDSWQKKYKDGRYFQLNTSNRKGFRRYRRIGKCQGNYQCSNPKCPIFVSTGVKNCLRKSRTDIEASNIYIPNDVMAKLTQEHIDMLV